MKRVALIAALCFMVVLPLACAKKAAPAPTPTPTPTAKPLELSIAYYVPPTYKDLFPQTKAFVDRVNELGKGKVKLTYYHSGKLLKAKELIPGLERGTVDMIFQTSSYTTGAWPIMLGTALPFLFKDCFEMYEKIKMGAPLRKLIDRVMEEKYGIKVIAMGAIPLEHIWTGKGVKGVRKPEDIKGLKVRAAGRTESRTIKLFGGSPVRLPSAEVYEALRRGTIDAAMFYCGTVGGRALYEVISACTRANFGAYSVDIYMKKDRWDELPDDIKSVIIEAAKEYEEAEPTHATKVHNEEYWPKVKEHGIEIIELTDEEIEAFKKASKPIYEWFKGEVGEDVGREFLKILGVE